MMGSSSKKKPGRPKNEALAASRREEILDVAARTFAERGYAKTDVQHVADLLGVGKGTVYRYFPSKRELFLAAVDRGMRRVRAQIDEETGNIEDPVERIAGAMRAYLGFFDLHPELIELFIQERAVFKDRKKPTYFEYRDVEVGRWQEVFRALISENRIRDIPVDRMTDVMGNLLYGAIFTNYFAGRKESFETQARDIIDVAYWGILSDAERSRRQAPATDSEATT